MPGFVISSENIRLYSGFAGLLLWSHEAVGNTAQTIIANGAEDAPRGITFMYIVSLVAGSAAQMGQAQLSVASPAISSDLVVSIPATGDWTFSLSSDGSLSVVRTSGTGTVAISILGLWM